MDEHAAVSVDQREAFEGFGGRIEKGPEAGEYLLPVDTLATSPAAVASTAISGDEMTAALEAIGARRILVVLDCCHAGGIGSIKAPSGVDQLALPETFYEKLTSGRGRAILAASRETEYSWVMPGEANSLFTRHLLEGLGGGVPAGDGIVHVWDLFEYVQGKVVADQPLQHPVFTAKLEDNLPVALWLGGTKATVPTLDGRFRFDAYVSYADTEPDSTYVWNTLLPALREKGLKVAVSEDLEGEGVERLVNSERGISMSKRTVIALSEAYLADGMAHFESVLAQHMGIQEQADRPLPVKIEPLDDSRLPVRLAMLQSVDLSRPARREHAFDRLIRSIARPLPTMSG